ncbi:MAG TPA: S8 family serine peptidase, partial [Thermoanaerobaculia bacterium]|nr:S8 family serine peptidase [Thermoanaerobaculia bacterium]
MDLASAPSRIQVLVELEDAPAARVYGEVLRAAGVSSVKSKNPAVLRARDEAVRAARAQLARIVPAQERFLAAVSPSVGATEIYRVQRAMNAIALEVDAAGVKALRRMPGVRSVERLELEYPTTSTSVPFLGTPALWNDSLGLGLNADGTGISIGIIDTGVDYQHATFGGTGVLTDYQANNRTVAPDAFFPSAKVVGGFDFAGDAYNGTAATVAQDPDPMDCNGHGTHVAGIAAGFGVNSDGTTFAGPYGPAAPFAGMRVGPGTAPKATLYALRVFGCGGGTTLTIQAIDWAIDPNNDDDFSDHLDVINMSLGAAFGSTTTSTAVASENAVLAGVIVVAAAGNSGDTYFIQGSPGSSGRTISVAGVQDSGLVAPSVRVNTPAGIAGFYTAGTAAFGSVPPPGGTSGNVVLGLDAADAAGPLTTDGCSPLTNAAAVAGNIAMIDRGTCGFAVKVKIAQDAGAIAVLIANSAAGVFGGMAGVDPTITIPSVMVTFADANSFKANIATLNVTLFSGGDTVYNNSSRGSRGLSSPIRLKPDIAAPGVSVTSAQTGVTCTGAAGSTGCQTTNATGFIANSQSLVLTGTSMATPHVAGIMALLLQIHPDWTVEQLKAVAMNGAIHDVTTQPGGGGTRFGPGRMGAGRVDPAVSAQATVIAFNSEESGLVSVTFDQGGVLGTSTQVKKVRLVNFGNTDATFDLGIDTLADAPGVAFSIPGASSVTIPANDSIEIDVQMDANAALMDHTRDATVSATQTAPAAPASVASLGVLNRHWLTEEGGYLTFKQGGNLKLRVPLYVAPWPASAITAPDTLATGGNPTGSTTLPLAGTDVCTGTLGAGPTCTGSFPTDEVSLVTPFELQAVSPPDPFEAPPHADIQYAGVAYSASADQLLFGVSTWGAWGTPTDVAFDIYIDCGVYTLGANLAADTCVGAPDGTWDMVLFNSNPGSLSILFGSQQNQQDSFLTAVFYRTRGSVTFGPPNFVNRVTAAAADTRVFDNQVMFLAADRTRLKINASGAFRYRVVSCPGSLPLCLDINGFRYDEAPGPYSWNLNAQGLDFGGNNLFFDLNGATLPVTWNTANMTANGSLGGLLLHHHNTGGQRAEVFTLDSGAANTADLSLIVSAVDSSVAGPLSAGTAATSIGQNVTFTVTITNNGPAAATGVQVSDTLPPGLTWVSDNSGGAYDPVSGRWTVGNLAVAGTATLQIVATVETTDEVCNVVLVGATSPIDPDSSDNQVRSCVNAPRSADLALSMTPSAATALVGTSITYTLTVTHNGTNPSDDPAYSLDVQEAFPSFPLLNPASFTASRGVYNPATGLWNLATLPPGGTATLSITLNAPNMAGPLTNQGTAAASTTDPNGANNNASATITILSPATVSATKTVAGTFNEGGTVTYTVVLTNSGSFDQQNNAGAELTDVLPAGLTLVSASATSGSATATVATNTVTWDGVVPAGGTVTVTITATIKPGTALTTITNQASIAFDSDGNGVNEAASMTDNPAAGGATDPTSFFVASPATVGSTKTVTGTFAPGGTVTYTVTLNNTSGAAQNDNPGNEFIDILPPTLVLLNATATAGTAVPTVATNTVTWNGPIPAGGSVTVTITARIADTAGGQTISNQGT